MKNWRTTVAGLIGGLIPIGQTVLNLLQTGQPIDWSKIGIGAGIIILGYLSKDFSVTGTGK